MRPLMKLSRLIGAQVCKVKGCCYHYANGCYDSWKVYACIRCHAFDQPLETIQPRPDFIDDDHDDLLDAEESWQLYCRDSRWFSCLPLPRWL